MVQSNPGCSTCVVSDNTDRADRRSSSPQSESQFHPHAVETRLLLLLVNKVIRRGSTQVFFSISQVRKRCGCLGSFQFLVSFLL